MRRSRCNQDNSEEIVETILTVLLVGFILLILVSFPAVGGGVAYFYFYKRRQFAKKRSDDLRYDFMSEPQQISLTETNTLNYFPHRSSSTYFDTTKRQPSEDVPESRSTLTLLHSKSIANDIPVVTEAGKGFNLASASNLQPKMFANKV